MEKKRMGRKASITALVVLIACAILLGALLLNKSDGPVTGMILSSGPITDAEAYKTAAEAQGEGTYLVVSNAFNKFETDYQSAIPAGQELFATVYFVECPAGAVFTAKLLDGERIIADKEGVLKTGPYGVISYSLGGELLAAGTYVFALYDGGEELFTQTFTVE